MFCWTTEASRRIWRSAPPHATPPHPPPPLGIPPAPCIMPGTLLLEDRGPVTVQKRHRGGGGRSLRLPPVMAPVRWSSGAHEPSAGDRGEVESGQEPGGTLHHCGDRIDQSHGGGLQPGGVVVAVAPHELKVECVIRFADYLYAIAAVTGRLGPVRAESVVEPGDVLEDDHHLAVTDPPELKMQRSDRALFDGPGIDKGTVGALHF